MDDYKGADTEEIGIVPPYMSQDWRVLRGLLGLAAAHATAAAGASTTEDVQKQLGLSMQYLQDAQFRLDRIKKGADDGSVRDPDQQ